MRGLFPSNGLAQARSMALFSDVLSRAEGFSGAWGSCLQGNTGTTPINKRISPVTVNPPQGRRATEHFRSPLEGVLSKSEVQLNVL